MPYDTRSNLKNAKIPFLQKCRCAYPPYACLHTCSATTTVFLPTLLILRPPYHSHIRCPMCKVFYFCPRNLMKEEMENFLVLM